MKCEDITEVLEKLSPVSSACDWDNVGLLVGQRNRDVRKIQLSLDATEEAVDHAVSGGADMLVTHHPMIFHGVKKINDDTALGRKILKLAAADICYYAMHTNFDIMGSMTGEASKRIGLKVDSPIEPTGYDEDKRPVGIGSEGELPDPMTVRQAAELVKEQFCLKGVMVTGDPDRVVTRAAICPGSGKSEINRCLADGVELLITGDIGHHDALDALEEGLSIIDATHYGLEHIFTDFMYDYLTPRLEGVEIEVYDSGCPFQYI